MHERERCKTPLFEGYLKGSVEQGGRERQGTRGNHGSSKGEKMTCHSGRKGRLK